MEKPTYAETTAITHVVAEDAPIGVQLWPTTHPKYAPNFTLNSVRVDVSTLRSAHGSQERTVVVWTYENGSNRAFIGGELVAVSLPTT